MSNSQAPRSREAGKALDRWLRQYAPLVRLPVTLTAGLGLATGFLIILQAWLLARIVDAVAIRGQTLDGVAPLLGFLLGVFALRALFAVFSESAAFAIAARIKRHLRSMLYARVEALGPAWTRTQRSGDLANTLVDGIESLEKYYALYLPQSALAALIPLSILVFVFPADWVSGLIMVLTAPLIPAFMILIGKGAERLNQRQWRRLARMSAHFLDMIEGLTTLKLFNASRAEAEVIARISDQYRRSTMAVLRIAFLSSLALEFLATLSIAMVAVFIGFRLLYGDIHYLPGFFVLLLAPEFYLPLRNMGTQYHARMEAIGAAERMVELMEAKPPAPTSEDAAQSLRAASISLSFERVTFGYPGGAPVLQALDFELNAGERVALVGPSGAGKTTVLQLVLGFLRPDTGIIRINGSALDTLDPEDWLRHLAWVPQRPTLFHGSVIDNIRLGHTAADAQAIREAARRAHADDFIARLPQAYDTMLGDRGQGLSGGQLQRIALARAFLKDAPLLILDEPTASLDPESERLITDAVERLAEGRTVLTVAHRLETVRRADRILVLDGGRVVESGAHAQLVAADGLYARLCNAYRGEAA